MDASRVCLGAFLVPFSACGDGLGVRGDAIGVSICERVSCHRSMFPGRTV